MHLALTCLWDQTIMALLGRQAQQATRSGPLIQPLPADGVNAASEPQPLKLNWLCSRASCEAFQCLVLSGFSLCLSNQWSGRGGIKRPCKRDRSFQESLLLTSQRVLHSTARSQDQINCLQLRHTRMFAASAAPHAELAWEQPDQRPRPLRFVFSGVEQITRGRKK